jgi:sporulation protein YlmC with PRC-barrel domain
MPVKNRQGEDLGTIKEVILDLTQKKVRYYAVMSVDDPTQAAERLLAVPLTAFEAGPNHQHLVLHQTTRRVQRPSARANYLAVITPAAPAETAVAEAQPFWPAPVLAAMEQRQAREVPGEPTPDITETEFIAGAEAPAAVNKTSGLIGMQVRNHQNERLGSIKDVVIDLDSERISYAVLATGGFLGFGEKLLAVPLSALSPSPDARHLILNAARQSVERAEGIGQNWPNVQNPAWGAERFWEDAEEEEEEAPEMQDDEWEARPDVEREPETIE